MGLLRNDHKKAMIIVIKITEKSNFFQRIAGKVLFLSKDQMFVNALQKNLISVKGLQ